MGEFSAVVDRMEANGEIERNIKAALEKQLEATRASVLRRIPRYRVFSLFTYGSGMVGLTQDARTGKFKINDWFTQDGFKEIVTMLEKAVEAGYLDVKDRSDA